jgi:uncharacterized protein (TIGR03032 family)
VKRTGESSLSASLWAHHHAELRDPHEVVVQWPSGGEVDPRLLEHRVRGRFWEAVAALDGPLLVTREYEHLVIALAVVKGRKRISFLRLPHPNGIAVDRARGLVYLASTRNPNLVYELAPCAELVPRAGHSSAASEPVLLPVRARFLPGCLYIHDLALIGGRLHANTVALNAVSELPPEGGFRPVWWPQSIDGGARGPRFERNYLQLNSIAAGRTLATSFFSASSAEISARRPGHLNYPVDKRGVVFSGQTRAVVATGLTRPHSARLRGSELWIDNSGYGELGRIEDGRFHAVAKLPGWTRGLALAGRVAFVGTSRVIPKYRQYAPGVDLDRSESGVHAVDLESGRVLGSLVWPLGNQIFGIEACPLPTTGFPFVRGGGRRRVQRLFFQGLPQPLR